MDYSGRILLRRLPLLNLLHRPYHTAGLILLTAFLAFSLFGGSVLVYSLQQGLNSITARLGANLIAVPLGCETGVESILLRTRLFLSGPRNRWRYGQSPPTNIFQNSQTVSLLSAALFSSTAFESIPYQIAGDILESR